MKSVRSWILIVLSILSAPGLSFAGGTDIYTVSAVVLSKNSCIFSTTTAILNFGILDTANSNDVTPSTSFNFICHGASNPATFSMDQDYGLYKTGPGANRMRHATNTTKFLNYTLTLNPSSGTVPKNQAQTLTVSGKVLATDYQNAYAGSYSDTVVISLNP